jgi:hypothetical protein
MNIDFEWDTKDSGFKKVMLMPDWRRRDLKKPEEAYFVKN